MSSIRRPRGWLGPAAIGATMLAAAWIAFRVSVAPPALRPSVEELSASFELNGGEPANGWGAVAESAHGRAAGEARW